MTICAPAKNALYIKNVASLIDTLLSEVLAYCFHEAKILNL